MQSETIVQIGIPDREIKKDLDSIVIEFSSPRFEANGKAGQALTEILQQLEGRNTVDEVIEISLGLYDFTEFLLDKDNDYTEKTVSYMIELKKDCSSTIGGLVSQVGNALSSDIYMGDESYMTERLDWFMRFLYDLHEKNIVNFPISLRNFQDAVRQKGKKNFTQDPELSRTAYRYLMDKDRKMLEIFTEALDKNESAQYYDSYRYLAVSYFKSLNKNYIALRGTCIGIPGPDGFYNDSLYFLQLTEQRKSDMDYWASRLENHGLKITFN